MKIFVGNFTAKQLINKEDKIAIEKSQKETGLKFIENKICFENGNKTMKVWLTDTF